MEKRRLVSNRTLLIIVSLLTVGLLLGSAILERIVLHAAEISSSVALSGPTGAVAPQAGVDYNVTASLNGNAVIAASQFVISYDPSKLQFVSAVPAAPWRSRRLLTQTAGSTNSLLWALLPTDDQGKTVQLTGPVSFGTLHFQAVAAGLASVKLDRTQTMIVGVDGQNQASLYNAVTSVQGAELLISPNATGATTNSAPIVSLPTSTGTTERILTDEAVAAFNQAVVFVSLKYPGLTTVRFGTDKSLLSNVQSAKLTSRQAVQLANLAAKTQYYYQVSVTDPKRHATVTGQVKSFQTTDQSSAAADLSQSNFRLFPAITNGLAELYMFVRDSNGSATSGAPTVSVTSGSAELTQTQLAPGLYIASIKSLLPTKQTVTVGASLGGEQLDSESVLFDPNFTETAEPALTTSNGLVFNSAAQLTLVGLIVVFLLATLAFIKLSRAK